MQIVQYQLKSINNRRGNAWFVFFIISGAAWLFSDYYKDYRALQAENERLKSEDFCKPLRLENERLRRVLNRYNIDVPEQVDASSGSSNSGSLWQSVFKSE